jgi:hypothetical protein
MEGGVIVDLSKEEIDTIIDDCISFLESNHTGQIEECGEMSDCPAFHFDEQEAEVVLRQVLIRKLEANE